MNYFKDTFSDDESRKKVLNMFPDEFKKGYKLFEQEKLKPVLAGDEPGWYLLDPKKTVKFNINE